MYAGSAHHGDNRLPRKGPGPFSQPSEKGPGPFFSSRLNPGIRLAEALHQQEGVSTPRPKRFLPVGCPVHATNRGNDRRQLFFKDADYEKVVALLAEAAETIPVEVHGYNILPNHLHLVLRQWEPGAISAYVHRVSGGIACHHRATTRTVGMGHVFQRRFWSHVIEDERHYIAVVRYVEANAKRAGLVNEAEAWRWGSLWERATHGRALLAAPIIALPSEWVALVNAEQPEGELARLRTTTRPGRPRRAQTPS